MKSALFLNNRLTNLFLPLEKIAQSSDRRGKESGLTLTELLVSLALVAILFLIVMMLFPKQLGRARDARRKTDLFKIKVAFEDYHNDNGCYPSADALNNCNSQDLAPYLRSIPCDPITREPYLYVPFPESTGCQGYRVYAQLEDADDPIIETLGCNGDEGCGWGASRNYGVAAGVTVYDPDGDPDYDESPQASPSPGVSPSPSGTPETSIWVYACDSSGVCNQFQQGDPFLEGCPITYEQTNCNNACADVDNRCP